MQKNLLIKYNKPTNESFQELSKSIKSEWADLNIFGEKINHLSYNDIDNFLYQYKSVQSVCVGDVFWTTGQYICQWCLNNNIKCYFLQHGQWIYVENKHNIPYVPFATLLLGGIINQTVRLWEYGKRSRLFVTGSPKYDAIKPNNGQYIYFSPPIMFEYNPGYINRARKETIQHLSSLKGIDKDIEIIIHPHYREDRVDVLKEMFPYAKFIDKNESVLPLISGSKCVLTHRNSTVVLDAIASCKKSVLINMEKMKSSYPTGYFGEFAVECKDINEIKLNLKNNFPVMYNYADRAEPYVLLGNASIRISTIIKENYVN